MSSTARIVSRRSFLRTTAMGVGVALLAACGATPTATPVPPTPVPPTATKPPAPAATQAPAAPAATSTPAPAPVAATATKPVVAPAPTAAPTTASVAATGKYKEAPMLADLVKSGKLPALDQRLPTNPLVEDQVPEIGVYSDKTIGMPVSDPNWPLFMYVQTPHRLVFAFQQNMAFWTLEQVPKVIPNLAEKWDMSADGLTYTFYIRKGLKWSDGQPFNADDVLFTYTDVIWDDRVQSSWSAALRTRSTVGGKPVDIQKVDDYTFKVVMAAKQDIIRRLFVTENVNCIIWAPKHTLSKVHPKYNTAATASDWNGAMQANSKPPVLWPWAPSQVAGDKLVLERNPYYHKVDKQGQQLPYLDHFVATSGTKDPTLEFMSGDVTMLITGVPADGIPLIKAREKDLKAKIMLYDKWATPSRGITFNMDVKDAGLKPLFNDPKFVDALMMLINRDQIATKLGFNRVGWNSRFGVPQITLLHPELDQKYPPRKLDIAGGLKALDAMGVKDTNGDTWREFPPGNPKAGQPLQFDISCESDGTTHSIAEELQAQFQAQGIKIKLTIMDETAWYNTYLVPGEDQAVIQDDVNCMRFWPTYEGVIDKANVNWRCLWLPGRKTYAPLYQPLTAESNPLPWAKKLAQLMDDAEAGKTDKNTAIQQAWDIIGTDAQSAGMLLVGALPSAAWRTDFGNNPLDWSPYFQNNPGVNQAGTGITMSAAANWEWYSFLRVDTWYGK
jgi:peptide/nickel transport system substrate-binding protein